jgi:hypothetical protein
MRKASKQVNQEIETGEAPPMPRTPPPGGYPGPTYKPPKIKKPKTKHKKKKGKKVKHHKAKHPKTLKPKGFHESGNVGREEAGSKGDTGDDKVNAQTGVGGGAPQPAQEVEASALGSRVDSGLLDAVMQLAGAGALGGTALVTWQREQDCIANRAWRRPGGLQRMGGL